MVLNQNQTLDDLQIYLQIYDNFIRNKYLSFTTNDPSCRYSLIRRSKNKFGNRNGTAFLELTNQAQC
jgi:hypothetical protein